VLGCDLKLLGCDWLTAVVTLQKLAGVRGGELSVCYETVAPFYNVIAMQHPLYISSKPPTTLCAGGERVTGPDDGEKKAEAPPDAKEENEELDAVDDGTKVLTDAVESIT
jgi:hypothetical protein